MYSPRDRDAWEGWKGNHDTEQNIPSRFSDSNSTTAPTSFLFRALKALI